MVQVNAQVELPFTPFGKAMASRRAIQEWIHREVLESYLDYIKTGQIAGRRGIIHSFLDGANPRDAQSPAFAQKIAVCMFQAHRFTCQILATPSARSSVSVLCDLIGVPWLFVMPTTSGETFPSKCGLIGCKLEHGVETLPSLDS